MAGEGSQHQENVTITLDGVALGTFRTFEGGGKTGDAGVARAGNMAPGVPTAGPPEYDDVTCERVMRHGTDSGLAQWCMDHYGGDVVAIRQHLDNHGSAGFHKPTTYVGICTGANESDFDADGNAVKVIRVMFKPGQVT